MAQVPFVGRQWRLDLDGDEFFIDLFMFLHGAEYPAAQEPVPDLFHSG